MRSLVVVLLSVLCLSVFGKDSRTSKIHRAFVDSRAATLGDWNSSTVSDFLIALDVDPASVSKLVKAGIDGSTLLHLSKDDLNNLGLNLGSQLKFMKILEELADEHDDVPMHHRDLWELRAFNRGHFYGLANLAIASPVAFSYTMHAYQHDFDMAFFGQDVGDDRNHFSWYYVFLCPGYQVYQYVREFYDTNPAMVAAVACSIFVMQLAIYIRLAAALSHGATGFIGMVVTIYLLEPIAMVIFSVIVRFIIFPITPFFLGDLAFYGNIFFTPFIFLALPFIGAMAVGAVAAAREQQHQEQFRRMLRGY